MIDEVTLGTDWCRLQVLCRRSLMCFLPSIGVLQLLGEVKAARVPIASDGSCVVLLQVA